MMHVGSAVHRARVAAVTTVLGLVGASCGLLAPRPDTSRYAVLASVDELHGVASDEGEVAGTLQVGLGPISVPDYLLSAAIVTRESGTRVVPSGTERWAEPFERSLGRVLALDLRREAGVGSVLAYPWYATERPAVQVEIAFSRCELDALEGVVVAAQWKVRWLDGSRATLERETRVQRQPARADGEGEADGARIALAISAALAELCGEIGEALRSVPKDG
jgi:uncharacterized lipoprotein YmbA